MYTAIDIIKATAQEFADVPRWKLEVYVDMCRPLVSRKQFGKKYEMALAYMVCHKLKMAGEGVNPLGDLGGIGTGFGLGSVSEGGSSISFSTNQSSNLQPDAELALTVYGLQFLQLRRISIVPIHITNEVDWPYNPFQGYPRPPEHKKPQPPCCEEPPCCQPPCCKPEESPEEPGTVEDHSIQVDGHTFTTELKREENHTFTAEFNREDGTVVNSTDKKEPCREECPNIPPEHLPPFPIATEKKFGGVKVKPGSGLTVDKEGCLSLDPALFGDPEDGEEP